MATKQCISCGKRIMENSTVCPYCGVSQDENIPNVVSAESSKEIKINENMNTCKTCGEPVSKNAKICPHCGETLLEPKKKTSVWTWLVLLLFIGYMVGEVTKKDTVSSTDYSTKKSISSVYATPVDIEDILSAYKNNEVGADNEYKGQVIQVTGRIDSIGKDILDNMYVTLGTGSKYEIPRIQAFFDDSASASLGRLKKGDRLTVVCRISGLMMNVLAKECVIK